jgi:hypothetical protein
MVNTELTVLSTTLDDFKRPFCLVGFQGRLPSRYSASRRRGSGREARTLPWRTGCMKLVAATLR